LPLFQKQNRDTSLISGVDILTIFAIVPVKNLDASKTRLSSILSPFERRDLTLAMLQDVLRTLRTAKIIDGIFVAGEDLKIQQTATIYGASYFSTENLALNSCINEASKECLSQRAGSVLVVPADIPLLKVRDIAKIIDLGLSSPSIVLSPSKDCGTNALYEHPPNLISACFGTASFLNHVREAYRNKIRTKIYFSKGVATDIDSVEDLKIVFRIENNTACKRVLEKIVQNNEKAKAYFKN
jgi:2-phospho-L-lactate guanylyltransferase